MTMSSQVEPRLLFSRDEIEAAVNRLAAEVRKDYHGKSPILIGILKGSFMFMADLIRLLDFPLEVEFVRLSSYGQAQESSGKVIDGHAPGVGGRNLSAYIARWHLLRP